MDAGAAGGYSPDTIPVFSSANQRYIQHAQDHWPMWEPGTRFPQEITGDVWDNVFDRAGWRVEPNWETTRIFSYPLTYQGRFDGGNSAGPNARVRVIAPGEYRVIFTATGLYLGAVRLRPGLPSLYQVFDRYTPRIALRARQVCRLVCCRIAIHADTWDFSAGWLPSIVAEGPLHTG